MKYQVRTLHFIVHTSDFRFAWRPGGPYIYVVNTVKELRFHFQHFQLA